MEYNRKKIEGLDPRQCFYINFHTQEYGTDRLVINGEAYMDRVKKNKPPMSKIQKILDSYPDRESYLWCNMRGWTVVFRTEINENMFDWNLLEKLR